MFDWDAYMEEVYGVFNNGTLDYSNLKGDTGALVYPAGFVWLFSAFYKLFDWDYVHFTTEYDWSRKNISGYEERVIRPTNRIYGIQAMYLFVYLGVLTLLFRVFKRTKAIPPYVFALVSLSRRVHSIFVLGLFNDCFALLFFMISLDLFTRDNWLLGCFWYSVAVSIKMNILLFAPGLLLLLLKRFGVRETIFKYIVVCALVQIVIALPFLATYPKEYIKGAFDFGRQFYHQWSVNWQFVPESIFQSKLWSTGLILGQLCTLLAFVVNRWCVLEGGVLLSFNYYTEVSSPSSNLKKSGKSLAVEHIVNVMFVSNFIGICFCRSLHYQFYVWYHFSIAYLLFAQTLFPKYLNFLLITVIEVAWNQHHPMIWSSLVLFCSHFIILFGLWRGSRLKMPKRNSA